MLLMALTAATGLTWIGAELADRHWQRPDRPPLRQPLRQSLRHPARHRPW